MKTTLVCAALTAACFAAPALAQSSVNVYGRLNMTVESQKNGDWRDDGVFNNRSHIGFKGVEDLGGGLKAGFVLENEFNPATGSQSSSQFWNGQAEVRLASRYGMVRLGRFNPESYYAATDLTSLHNHNDGSSADRFYFDPNMQLNGVSNKIAYRTPTMLGGLWIEGSVQEAGLIGERGYDVALQYVRGDLTVGGGYSQAGDFDQFSVSAMYKMTPDLVLGGYFQRADIDQQGNYRRYAGKRNSLRVAAMYTRGATELHANFGYADNIGGLDKTNSYQYTLAVNQNLSKRTKVYAFYTHVGNDDILQVYTRSEFSSVALGVRHDF